MFCIFCWHIFQGLASNASCSCPGTHAMAMHMIMMISILQQQQDSPMPMLEAGTNLPHCSLPPKRFYVAWHVAWERIAYLVEVCFGRKALIDETWITNLPLVTLFNPHSRDKDRFTDYLKKRTEKVRYVWSSGSLSLKWEKDLHGHCLLLALLAWARRRMWCLSLPQ